ncbi:hypothetical protein [Phenylobacterium sp.]|jgi:hypothetical protein|uniref:calcium-binding protein n=1 Tax=Phenylobacterium sp. TaxID=1871053 RepID=UPI002F959BEC
MGDILPFVQRVRAAGDWTADERSRLEELAQRFAAAGVHVDIVYGVTDDGDPWCVVKDENEEVLVHVARIGSAFVVHHAVDDILSSAQDLPSALGERLAWSAEREAAVVVPFSRQAQTFIALVVATAFFYESAVGLPTGPERHEDRSPEPETPPPPALIEDDASPDRREVAAHAMAADADEAQPLPTAQVVAAAPLQLAAAVTPEAPLPAPEPVTAKTRAADAGETLVASASTNVVQGSSGDDSLVGGAGSDVVIGGDGDDTLSGGGGGADLLQGGAGDDRLELGEQVTADGGEGADTFVVVSPHVLGHADTLLGVILDFRAAEGDRIVTHEGRPVPPEGVTPSGVGPGTLTTLAPTASGGDRRVDVDIDGDGMVDGYVILRGPPPVPDAGAPQHLPGMGFSYPDPVG